MQQGFEIRTGPGGWHVVYHRVTDDVAVAHYSRHTLTAYVGGRALNNVPVTEEEGRALIEAVLAR